MNEENQNQDSKKPIISKKAIYIIVSLIIVVVAGFFSSVILKSLFNRSPNSVEVSRLNKISDAINSQMTTPGSVVSKSNGPSLVIDKLKDSVWTGLPEGADILSYTITQNTADLNKNDYDKLLSLLEQFELKEIDVKGKIGSEYMSDKIIKKFYSSSEITCNVINKPEKNVNNSESDTVFYLSVSCANKTDFAAIRAEIEPFADAYIANKKDSADIIMGNIFTNNSPVQGYKNANLSVLSLDSTTNSRAIFYQSTDKKWYLFAVSSDQNKIECSEYDNQDLVNAFTGFMCWDSSINSNTFVSKPQSSVPNPGEKLPPEGGSGG